MEINNEVSNKIKNKTNDKNHVRNNGKTNIKKKLLTAASIITFICAGIVGYMYQEINEWELVMMPNVIIEGINYTGKTKDEVLTDINKTYGDIILDKTVEIKAGEKEYSIGFEELKAKYNTIHIVDEAFEYGKKLGFIDKYKLIKNPRDKEFELKFTYDSNLIDKVVGKIEEDVNKEPVNATIKYLGKSKFEVTDDVKGAKLDSEKLIIDINNGIMSKAKELKFVAPIETLAAKITGESLRTINSSIGSFSTRYTNSGANRSSNIALATKAINETILMPGEVFSFNDTVGQRTREKGYKEAHVIVNGEYVDGLGGGICQASSTLYNVALLAGLEIVERHHHTYPSSYVPVGQDATVDYGNLDVKFKNNGEYPIYISAYTQNKQEYFTIFSNGNLNKTEKKIWNDIYKKYPASYKIIEDSNLPKGTEKIDKKAHTGYKVKVYRVTYENGVKINTETISSDYFVPVKGVKRVGTK
ncbi:VanW family protein [Clostridium sediminicola]|uniref:VanW family protein n=1 Tax=Clostridium sediminicola TaxID=3114879 RepID=UPI0031F1DE4A